MIYRCLGNNIGMSQNRRCAKLDYTSVTYEHAYSVCIHRRALHLQNTQAGSCAIEHTPAFRQ